MEFFATDLQYIKGIGPKLAEKLAELLGGRRILDFLLHRPTDLKFRPMVPRLADGTPGEIITVPLEITGMKPAASFRGGRRPLQFFARDKDGVAAAIQFWGTGFSDYWSKQLPIGETRIISGKLENGVFSHPDYIAADPSKIPEFQAIYPLCEGLTQKIMQNLRDQITPRIPRAPEWLNDETLAAFDNLSFAEALRAAHSPKTLEDVAPTSRAICRLAFDELFAHQIAVALTRKKTEGQPGISMQGTNALTGALLELLPFQLTESQKRAVDEILADMAKPVQMRRLVQGDVGSGKTIVSLLAMLRAAESGFQSVLLAPTDALAQQHYAKIRPLLERLNIHSEILTGRDKGAERREKLVALKSGRAKIIIGTHALFQEAVEYRNLGLAVIDEQHRFGVGQRLDMTSKGAMTDVLALSATPIPRTLSMTIYGDMDVSVINEKPAGRLPIKTTKLSAEKIPALCARLKNEIEKGARVFWVCPLVAESEASDLMSAENRFRALAAEFGAASVGLAHGKMPKAERDAALAKFASGEIKILVATTVVEVGIDVPEASVMVIEDAWRFGLAALHQLRGRVGRGARRSFCILCEGRGMTGDGARRLEILCETDDGFEIAEHDLAMRGIGEMLGVRQSGFINYRFVDWRAHKALFRMAAASARELVAADPGLKSARGVAARTLLELFGRADAMQFVKAG
jgi:ATP-dependent DNA helicase RecG